MSKNRIFYVRCIILLLGLFGPVLIFIPRGLEASTTSLIDERFKPNFCFFLLRNGHDVIISNSVKPSLELSHTFGVSNLVDVVNEGSAKLGGGLVKLLDLSVLGVSALGEEVTTEHTDQSASGCPERKTSEFNWHDFFLGFGFSFSVAFSAVFLLRIFSA